MVAVAAANGTVSLWDTTSERRMGPPLAGSVPPLQAMAFSPTGRTILTGSSDGTTVLWNVDQRAWADRACALAGRTLNRQEWGQMLPGRSYHPMCGA
jgi:WD40 repeat protein